MASNVLTIVKKELKSYFNSPIAYIAVVSFLVFTSVWLFYIQQFVARDLASLRIYFSVVPIVFIILMPALTMRSWAEERKLGTIELLLTLPFRETEVVLGKFLSALALLMFMLILSIPVPLSLGVLGNFDKGQIVGEFVGAFLLGAAGIAIGLFISSISVNQISAFIASVLVLLFLTLISQITAIVNLPYWASSIINYFSLGYHFENFGRGLLDSRDLIYYLVIIFFSLYLNTKVMLFRK